MTQSITTKRAAPARSKTGASASERAPASPATRTKARGAAPEDLLLVLRGAARELIGAGEGQRELALALVEMNYRVVSEASPVTDDLRQWQLLASDLAAALAPLDAARAQRARRLADEIRATVVMIARNPADQLIIRPASRQVLLGLEMANGRVEHGVLRERCGLSAPNFSNLLKPLRAHGLIDVIDGLDDRRSKIVVLTSNGRKALASLPRAAAAPVEPYHSYISRAEPGTAVGGYSPELACD